MGMRLARGMWVQSEGVVYDTFSDELHIVPFDWLVRRGIVMAN